MTVTQPHPLEQYDPPAVEVLGILTDLAEGAGEEGTLIVMQTG